MIMCYVGPLLRPFALPPSSFVFLSSAITPASDVLKPITEDCKVLRLTLEAMRQSLGEDGVPSTRCMSCPVMPASLCDLENLIIRGQEVEKTGNSRDINRHRYSIEEAQQVIKTEGFGDTLAQFFGNCSMRFSKSRRQ